MAKKLNKQARADLYGKEREAVVREDYC